MARCTGTCVDWMGGYGYIAVDSAAKQQVFCHHSVIKVEEDGFRALEVGQKVEFDIVEEANGKFKADNVTAIGGGALPSGPARRSRPAPRVNKYVGGGRGVKGGHAVGTCVDWMGGYGFLELDSAGEGDKQQVFCPHPAIKVEEGGFRALAVGQKVEFDIIEEENGKFTADNVTAIGGGDLPSGPRRSRGAPRGDSSSGNRRGGGRGRSDGNGDFRGGHGVGTCVKWMGGYGFIAVDSEGEGDKQQVFCPHSAIFVEEDGFRALAVGQKVEFDIIDEKNGKFKAENVTAIGGGAVPSGRRPAPRDDGYDGGRRGGRGGAPRGSREDN